MKFFIDTANLDEIAEAKSWGCLAGVTTNPSLYAKTGGKLADFEPHMLKIAELCEGLPVSAESTATTAEGMIEEGKRLAALAPNIVVKLPVCEAGLAACRALADAGKADFFPPTPVPATSARLSAALTTSPRTASRSSPMS